MREMQLHAVGEKKTNPVLPKRKLVEMFVGHSMNEDVAAKFAAKKEGLVAARKAKEAEKVSTRTHADGPRGAARCPSSRAGSGALSFCTFSPSLPLTNSPFPFLFPLLTRKHCFSLVDQEVPR